MKIEDIEFNTYRGGRRIVFPHSMLNEKSGDVDIDRKDVNIPTFLNLCQTYFYIKNEFYQDYFVIEMKIRRLPFLGEFLRVICCHRVGFQGIKWSGPEYRIGISTGWMDGDSLIIEVKRDVNNPYGLKSSENVLLCSRVNLYRKRNNKIEFRCENYNNDTATRSHSVGKNSFPYVLKVISNVDKEDVIRNIDSVLWDIEIVRFSELECPIFKIEGDVAEKSETDISERMEFISDYLSKNENNFINTIRFEKRRVKIYRPLLLQKDPIDFFVLDTLKKMDINFDIKDLFILLLNIRKRRTWNLSNLRDFYLFFKTLRSRNHSTLTILELIELFGKDTFSVKDIYDCFKEFCMKHENNDIKSWFTDNPKKIKDINVTHFRTAFALLLFLALKSKLKEDVLENSDFLAFPYSGIILYHVRNCILKSLEQVKLHYDIILRKYTSIEFGKDLEQFENTDLILVSSDDFELKCHSMVLISRYNFFHRMFQFNGKEMEEFKKNGTIHLEDLNNDVLKVITEFAYENSFEERRTEILIQVLIHVHIHEEFALFEAVVSKLCNLCTNCDIIELSSSEIQNMLIRIGCQLMHNEEVLKYVIPVITRNTNLSVQEIRNFIQDSYLFHETESRIERMEKKRSWEIEDQNSKFMKQFEKLDNQNQDLKKQNDRIMKLLEGLIKYKIRKLDKPILGGGVIRERSSDSSNEEDHDDDDDDQEESTKKKRKLE